MTPAVHTEATFESAIEDVLLARGWIRGNAADYDRARALDPTHLVAFIKETQPELWAQLRTQHGANLEPRLIDTLIKFRRTAGTIELLRRGFKFYGKTIRLAYFAPATRLNPEAEARYRANRLAVVRQVRFVPGEDYSVDVVLFLNGLPVATLELKNELTGQSVVDAKQQYRRRDANAPLLRFKEGALVHFAVDTERVAMATRLAGDDTYFLPFDRGHEGGAGNPPHPSGYRSAYLWEEVLARDSFLDILGRFMHLQTEERWRDGKRTTREIMLFPRYHQLDVVRKLERAARAEGPGHSYLIQHSAGSGKTNSIAWLAHRLASLHDDVDEKVYHSVVVLTDRTVLDRQLQDAIYEIEHKQGVVERIGESGGAKSTQLAEALERGVPIIVCTLQTFPFVAQKIGELPSRRYAVIVDEAHSSQTGEAAQKVKEVLRAESLEEAAFVAESEEQQTTSSEDEILRVMDSRGPQPNLSFFAFTATPKGKTLERFGWPGEDGEYRPFHLYTMRQAIEERFILDVLQH
jgi:type I restriction enzyme R subunit